MMPADLLPATRALPVGVVDPQHFRRSVAKFATGVAILSCLDDDDQPVGMTISSFTSISLDPATVLVSLREGRTQRCVRRRGAFAVSVLADAQQAWSQHFAGRMQPGLQVAWISRAGLPMLREALAWFGCQVAHHMPLHDHPLFLAHVHDCDSVAGRPLVHFDGGFRRADAPAAEPAHPRSPA
jgi:styrene monooxygenase reductase component